MSDTRLDLPQSRNLAKATVDDIHFVELGGVGWEGLTVVGEGCGAGSRWVTALRIDTGVSIVLLAVLIWTPRYSFVGLNQ